MQRLFFVLFGRAVDFAAVLDECFNQSGAFHVVKHALTEKHQDGVYALNAGQFWCWLEYDTQILRCFLAGYAAFVVAGDHFPRSDMLTVDVIFLLAVAQHP